MKKTGIIICTRLDSRRVHKKATAKLNGTPTIIHLLNRVLPTGVSVVLATPASDAREYSSLLEQYGIKDSVKMFSGFDADPLMRMHAAAESLDIDTIVRVCHDKIFFDESMFFKALDVFNKRDLDYLFSSKFIEGSGFEIISLKALEMAAQKFQGVEHISYAIKSVTENICDFDPPSFMQGDYRFLIDYPEDQKLLDLILARCGNDCTLFDAIQFVDKNKWAFKINELPKLTVYTCAYNAEKFIEKCMGSVATQTGFKDFEYLIIDDHSSDDTTRLVARFSTLYPNVRWIRNSQNVGLASSSNIALKESRSKYIMRLDADDYFSSRESCNLLLKEIEETRKDAIYPSNYFGSHTRIQLGKENHHIGGTIFDRRAINHIKFTDGLRGWEGLDFFERAKDILSIGYLSQPTFFYTQRSDSMSKTNLDERERMKKHIIKSVSHHG